MAVDKKYYWLKLKDTFFEDDTISFIEEQENGIKYSNFYLKLCLKSVRTNGKLIRLVGETLMPYDVKSLSKLTNVDFDTVNSAMSLFEKLGIISVLENGELYLSQVQEMIGSETEKASLMRRKRAEVRIGNNVTKMLPYIEKEIEKEKEEDENYISSTILPCTEISDTENTVYDKMDTNNNSIKNNSYLKETKDIIDYLNQKANKQFKHTTSKTKKLINARIKEGFSTEDFKTVIDNKCEDWLRDEKMNEYLRPETLFGTKFESYLNSKQPNKKESHEQGIIKNEKSIEIKYDEYGNPFHVY